MISGQIGDAKMWADFGLSGLVIFALFTGGIAFVGWVAKHLSTVTKMHSAERAEWRETGLRERAEWRSEHLAERMEMATDRREITTLVHQDREAAVSATAKMTGAISDLRDVLSDMKSTCGSHCAKDQSL